MKRGIAFIRKELTGIFPPEEIESLLFLIFEKIKGYSRTRFLLSKEEKLEDEEMQQVENIIQRLKNHEPIQYILGNTEFYGLPFYTVPGVLIPRPETEELVDWIIRENQIAAPAILDMGTGSGCIAVSLGKNIPFSKVMACDISPICRQTALRNAQLNRVAVSVVDYDILKSSPAISFPLLNIVVSNPPYVRESEKQLMAPNVLDYEPELALFVSDERPLLYYEQIADFSLQHLKPGGLLYFEINEALGSQCAEMLHQKGYCSVELKQDINGKDRMLRGTAPCS